MYTGHIFLILKYTFSHFNLKLGCILQFMVFCHYPQEYILFLRHEIMMHLTIVEDLGSMKYGKTREKQQNDECRIWEHDDLCQGGRGLRNRRGTQDNSKEVAKKNFFYLDIEYIGICFIITLQTVQTLICMIFFTI